MSLWSKIDNFFAYKPQQGEGAAAAAAAAAADVPLYVVGLITRPDRAKDLIGRVERFKKLASDEQAEELMPLYLDLEAYVIEHEPVKKYTKESLRLEIYTVLNLKNSKLPFIGFFTPGVEGAVMLATELFSNVAGPAFEVLGKEKVGQIILSAVEGTIFEGVEYHDTVLDFSRILPRLKKEISFDKEFKRAFNKVSLEVATPVMALRGAMPSVHIQRNKIIDNWRLLEDVMKPAWQEQNLVIPISTQAQELMTSVGMGELLIRGEMNSVETKFVSKKGDPKPVSMSASTLKDEVGNIQGMVIVAKDLSGIRRLEAEKMRILESAKEEAEAEVTQRTQELEKSKKELENTVGRLTASEQQQKAANQHLNAANQQLAAAQKNLQDKLLELERFNKVAVGRELRMVELKEEIARLKGSKIEADKRG